MLNLAECGFTSNLTIMTVSRTTKWVSTEQLSALLSAFERGTEVSDAGVSYTSDEFSEFYEILPDAFTVRPAISRAEAISLFRRALLACRRAGPVSAEAITAQATLLHRERLAVPKERYTVWTKLRTSETAHGPGFILDWRGVRLRTAHSLPSWLSLDDYFISGLGTIMPNDPHGFGHAILTCDDRGETRAIDRMLDAFQLMQGLVNLYDGFHRRRNWGGRNAAEGGLWLGPNQFLFRGRRFCGEDRIWYNPEYDEDAWQSFPPTISRLRRIASQARRALTALDAHPLSDILVKAIMLLQDGFSTRDSSHRLLRYWSALQQLYVEADAKGRSNEKVIDRAIFAERVPQLSRWKLEHIARLRNDHVHAGGNSDDLHALCQFLRVLLVRHLNHWIFAGQDLPDHASLLALVKLPGDREFLTRLRSLVDRRLALLDEMPPDEED